MRIVIGLLIVMAMVVPAHASGRRSTSPFSYGTGSKASSSRVTGHYKPSAGKYVMPHNRSTGDRTQYNNWSTKGNVNLYTGKRGTKYPVR